MPRDLEADMEICKKATTGPWVQDQSNVKAGGYTLFYTYTSHRNDAAFIAAAREGWPEAIERAIKAESKAEVNSKTIKLMIEDRDAKATRTAELQTKAAALTEANDIQRANIQQLSAQVAGLRDGLETVVYRCENYCGIEGNPNWGPDSLEYRYLKEILASPDPGEKYRAQVAKMQGVVDAARKVRLAVDLGNKYSVSKNGDNFAKDRLLAWYSDLEQALADLEGGANE